MASTEERNQNRTRPSKSAGARRKRQNDHKKRLIALGMDEAAVNLLNSSEIRTKLKHPKKVTQENGAK